MDGHCLLLFAFLLGFCLCPLSSLAVLRSGPEDLLTVHLNGRALGQSSSGKKLLIQVRGLQMTKTEAETGKVVQNPVHKEDKIVARSETGASLDAESPAGTDHDNTTKKETKPGDEETHSANVTSIPPPPPSVEREDGTSMAENTTDGTKSVPKMEESDDHSKDNGTKSDMDDQKTSLSCGGSHCEAPKKLISACLTIPGDGAHELSLFITYEGDKSVMVKVNAPEFLIANPVEVLVSKGKSETIHFLMDLNHKETLLKPEAMQHKTIVVSSVYGDCKVAVPTEYLRNSIEEREPQFSSSLPSMDPRVIAYLLAFAFFSSGVGAWLCYKCRGKKRAGDAKYQQLEMNGLGQSSPKERVEERGTESWDDWDDDWEDTEAAKSSSSRLSQSLSSRGLAARRGTKDGWDD